MDYIRAVVKKEVNNCSQIRNKIRGGQDVKVHMS